MMIVDLIDEVDFKDKLIAIGIPLTESQSMAEVQDTLLSWLKEYPEQRPFVIALFEEMQNPNTTILPDVLAVINTVD